MLSFCNLSGSPSATPMPQGHFRDEFSIPPRPVSDRTPAQGGARPGINISRRSRQNVGCFRVDKWNFGRGTSPLVERPTQIGHLPRNVLASVPPHTHIATIRAPQREMRSTSLPQRALLLLATLLSLAWLPETQAQLALADGLFSALGLENPFTSRAAGPRGITYRAADTWYGRAPPPRRRHADRPPPRQLPRLHLQIALLLRCAPSRIALTCTC